MQYDCCVAAWPPETWEANLGDHRRQAENGVQIVGAAQHRRNRDGESRLQRKLPPFTPIFVAGSPI